ncbi:MAG: glycosyltransferase family 39 protein [Anaerolineae bacterium]
MSPLYGRGLSTLSAALEKYDQSQSQFAQFIARQTGCGGWSGWRLPCGCSIWTRGLWEDEALTILVARQPLIRLFSILSSADVHPPLYFLLVKIFMSLGQSEFVIRLPSALCSAAAVGVLYLLGRDMFDERVGLVGALLMAVSPLQLLYAQEARMYAQLLLLAGLSGWTFFHAWSSQGWRWWILFTVSAAVACYTLTLFFPLFLAMTLYVGLVERSRERIWRFGLARLPCGRVILTLAGCFIFAKSFSSWPLSLSLLLFWIVTPHPLILLTTLSGFFVGISLPAFGTAVSLGVTLLIIFVVLNSVRHALIAESGDKQALIWLLLWAFVPLLGLYLISLIRPIFQLRTVMLASLPLYLLLSWGVTCAARKRFNQWLLLPTLFMMSLSLYNFYFDPVYAKPPWREAAAYVRDHAQPGDVAIHTSEGSYLPFLVYNSIMEQVRLQEPEAPDSSRSQTIISAVASAGQSIEAATRGRQRAWLILGLDRAIEFQLAQKDYFNHSYTLLREMEIEGIYISEYSLRK